MYVRPSDGLRVSTQTRQKLMLDQCLYVSVGYAKSINLGRVVHVLYFHFEELCLEKGCLHALSYTSYFGNVSSHVVFSYALYLVERS